MANSIVSTAIDREKQYLSELGSEIWKHPELNYEEHTAHRLLTDFLEVRGFGVERGYAGLATAFRARFGSGKPNVCVISEYDALPGIGHACGHNLIAVAGVAAGLGVKAFLETSGQRGTVTVMGTPAEEGGGGKVDLINNKAFEDVEIAMMVHPAPFECPISGMSALGRLKIEYEGKAAHAAAYPWVGVNALDAAVMAYSNISVLRQQMKPSWRVHGIITNGGVKPNIIPEKSSLEVWMRADRKQELSIIRGKLVACFESAATATGCSVRIEDIRTFYDVFSNNVLAKLYASNLKTVGVSEFEDVHKAAWSTDMGNVSYVVPSLHPSYLIGSGKELNHTREFTAITNTEQAYDKTFVVAKAMALTCINVLSGGDELLQEIQTSFKTDA